MISLLKIIKTKEPRAKNGPNGINEIVFLFKSMYSKQLITPMVDPIKMVNHAPINPSHAAMQNIRSMSPCPNPS